MSLIGRYVQNPIKIKTPTKDPLAWNLQGKNI